MVSSWFLVWLAEFLLSCIIPMGLGWPNWALVGAWFTSDPLFFCLGCGGKLRFQSAYSTLIWKLRLSPNIWSWILILAHLLGPSDIGFSNVLYGHVTSCAPWRIPSSSMNVTCCFHCPTLPIHDCLNLVPWWLAMVEDGRWRWSKAVKVGYDFKVGLKNREMADWKMIEKDSKDKLWWWYGLI